ncbi:unnamed protein product, partial [Amoebophrya sp. A25]|eukprot:GSA25T00022268001.1
MSTRKAVRLLFQECTDARSSDVDDHEQRQQRPGKGREAMKKCDHALPDQSKPASSQMDGSGTQDQTAKSQPEAWQASPTEKGEPSEKAGRRREKSLEELRREKKAQIDQIRASHSITLALVPTRANENGADDSRDQQTEYHLIVREPAEGTNMIVEDHPEGQKDEASRFRTWTNFVGFLFGIETRKQETPLRVFGGKRFPLGVSSFIDSSSTTQMASRNTTRTSESGAEQQVHQDAEEEIMDNAATVSNKNSSSILPSELFDEETGTPAAGISPSAVLVLRNEAIMLKSTSANETKMATASGSHGSGMDIMGQTALDDGTGVM